MFLIGIIIVPRTEHVKQKPLLFSSVADAPPDIANAWKSSEIQTSNGSAPCQLPH